MELLTVALPKSIVSKNPATYPCVLQVARGVSALTLGDMSMITCPFWSTSVGEPKAAVAIP